MADDVGLRTRYPWAPLESLLSVETFEGEVLGRAVKTLARRLGVDGKQVYRWRQNGMSRDHAETMAERAGWVPYEVWPSILHDVAPIITRTCQWQECRAEFEPSSHRQRYCQPRCRDRAKVWRWRHSPAGRAANVKARRQPAAAEANRQRRRKYYAENGAYERARQRRYDAAKRAEREAA